MNEIEELAERLQDLETAATRLAALIADVNSPFYQDQLLLENLRKVLRDKRAITTRLEILRNVG